MTALAERPLETTAVQPGPTPAPRRFVSVFVVAFLVLAAVLPVRAQFRTAVSPQDEGLLLEYPTRVLDGAVPNADFESVYGAASVWTVAAAFRVAGESVAVERTVGVLYRTVLVAALVALAWRRRGRFAALATGLLAIFLAAATGIAAHAWVGAIALGVLALLLLDIASARDRPRGLCIAAGLCLGLAVSFRIDIGLAVLLVCVALAVATRRPPVAVVAGVLLGLVPLAVSCLQAGVGAVVRGQLVEPIFVTGPGRRLPLSGLEPVEALVLGLCVLIAGAWAVLGARELRDPVHPGVSRAGATAMLIGAFEFGILPQAFQRADAHHLVYVACVVLPSAVFLPWPATRGTTRVWTAAVAVVLFVIAAPVAGNAQQRATAEILGLQTTPSYRVGHGDRNVTVGSRAEQRELAALLAAVGRNAPPGARLVVGPHDLRRAMLGDTFLYFLLPEYQPGTHYLEFEPGVANADDSRLADDVAQADVLILDDRTDGWVEPNDSAHRGPDRPNRIVRSNFEEVGSFGPWHLYTRTAAPTSR